MSYMDVNSAELSEFVLEKYSLISRLATYRVKKKLAALQQVVEEENHSAGISRDTNPTRWTRNSLLKCEKVGGE